MKKFAVLALLPFASWASDWSPATKITEVNTGYKEPMILFKTEAAHANPNSSCNATFYSVRPENANVDQIFSILLAAKMANASIQIGVDPTTCSADGNKYISVSRVRLN